MAISVNNGTKGLGLQCPGWSKVWRLRCGVSLLLPLTPRGDDARCELNHRIQHIGSTGQMQRRSKGLRTSEEE